jgi:hypothetical protein
MVAQACHPSQEGAINRMMVDQTGLEKNVRANSKRN